MDLRSYHKKEITLGVGKANLYSLSFLIPTLIVFLIPFLLIWHDSLNVEDFQGLIKGKLFLFLGLLIAGIFLHEAIHGLTWAIFCKNGFKSIKFGVIWKAITPYCHCKEVLPIWHYRLGTIMPGLILGFIPALIGIISGSVLALIFGIVFTVAAGGDFIFIWLLRKEASNRYVEDHPDKIGCILYSPK